MVAIVSILCALLLDGVLAEVDEAAVVDPDVDRPEEVVRLGHEEVTSWMSLLRQTVAYLRNIRILGPVAPLTGQYSRGGLN